MTDDKVVKPVVLLVDDDKGMRDAARTFFEVHKYRANSASNLSSALNVFHQYPNDLMVGFVDIHMHASTTGLDIIQYGHEVVPHRVVLYGWTGNWTLETERRVFAAGGHGLLEKNDYVFERMKIRTRYPNALALVEKSSKDPLTGLKNLATFQEDVLLEMMEMKDRKKWETLHLIALDMKSFKAINDSYGHLVGDRCLKRVADIIRSHVRRRDHPCRRSGDEFLVCMVGVTRKQAIKTAGAIKRAVAETVIEGREGVSIPLSVDWGLAELQRQHVSYPLEPVLTEFMGTADERLYASKRAAQQGEQEVR